MVFKNRELVERALFPVGVNALVMRQGMILLGKRKSAYHDGEWGVPGGHLEEGESMLDCVARELKEETGLVASGFKLVITDNDPRPDKFHYIHFVFLAEGVTGEPKLAEPDKCYEWGWFTLDNLPDPLFIGHKKFIQGFAEGKEFID